MAYVDAILEEIQREECEAMNIHTRLLEEEEEQQQQQHHHQQQQPQQTPTVAPGTPIFLSQLRHSLCTLYNNTEERRNEGARDITLPVLERWYWQLEEARSTLYTNSDEDKGADGAWIGPHDAVCLHTAILRRPRGRDVLVVDTRRNGIVMRLVLTTDPVCITAPSSPLFLQGETGEKITHAYEGLLSGSQGITTWIIEHVWPALDLWHQQCTC